MNSTSREWLTKPFSSRPQLEIGEDAYWFLRMRKVADRLLHGSLAGVADGATVATPVVAGTFFPAGGILGVIGLGTAVTPIGWVIGGRRVVPLLYG